MSSRHVVLLTGWFYPESQGGTETYVHWLAQGLADLGHEVTIAAPSVDGNPAEYEYNGLPVHRYKLNPRPTTAEVKGTTPPEHIEEFKQWLNRMEPDVVHFHSYTRGCGYFHAQCAQSLGLPLVATIHTPALTCRVGTLMRWGKDPCDGKMFTWRCSACWLHWRGVPRVVASVLAGASVWAAEHRQQDSGTRLGRLALGTKRTHQHAEGFLCMVDTIVVMSRWQQDLLANNGIALEKIRLIRHGIPNTNEPLPKSEPEIVRRTSPLRIGFVGRLTPLKGPHVLVKALRSLPRSISLEVNIYGNVQSEQDSEYLVRLQAAAHRDGRIRFHGELEFGKKAAAFNSLDILAIPSVSFETGPLVLLEAHNAGLPVLASRIGTIEEMIRDGVDGLLVKPGDIPAWASAIRHLFELWRDDRWNWDIPKVKNMGLVSKEMDRIYAALLNRKFEN